MTLRNCIHAVLYRHSKLLLTLHLLSKNLNSN